MEKNEKAPKMVACKHCGAEIAAGAKTCPKCGGKNKKPIYKRAWFIILVVLVVFGGISGMGSSDTGSSSSTGSNTEQKIEYKKTDLTEMMSDLEENASNASDKYKDKYIEVTGMLSQIDSDGAYINIIDPNDDMAVAMGDLASAITCRTGYDDEIMNKIKKLKKEQMVTIRGQITGVGEYIKYELNIDEIVDK